MTKTVQLAGPNNNVGGTFSRAITVPLGTTMATFTISMNSNQLGDSTNYIQQWAQASFQDGHGFRYIRAISGEEIWHGGPGQVAPTLIIQWNANNPPSTLKWFFENGIQGVGSEAATTGTTVTFS